MGWADSYIRTLQESPTVTFRPRGNSMTPHIKSGQQVTVERCETPEVGDIVLCRVRGKQYLHFVRTTGKRGYLIGNAHGKMNGWTGTIYGKVIQVGP